MLIGIRRVGGGSGLCVRPNVPGGLMKAGAAGYVAALAAGLLALPLVPSPALAVTAGYAKGVLAVSASPGDRDLDVRVLVYGSDVPFLHYTDVTIDPPIRVPGCTRHGDYSECPGFPDEIRLDGGQARAAFEVLVHSHHSAVQIRGGKAGTDADVSGYSSGSTTFTGGPGADRLVVGRKGALVAVMKGGVDEVGIVRSTAQVRLGGGADLVRAGSPDVKFGGASVVAHGESGDDTFRAMLGSRVFGGAGQDLFFLDADPDATYPGWGRPVEPQQGDVIRGGTGRDTVVLDRPGRRKALQISLDDRANDGEPGERDDYGSDVEDVLVRGVPATVVGSAADNHLELLAGGTARGGAGDDVLVGGTRLVGGSGFDVLLPGADTAVVRADDGARDVIRCSGDTVVHADSMDTVIGSCQVVSQQ
jgi:hypothetical protein